MIKRTTIIDDETGEVVSNKDKAFAPAFDEEKGYLFWARKSFSKSYHDVDFPEEMNDLEIGRMARLAKKIFSNTNMLGYRGNGGIKPYDINMMAAILKLQPRQARNFIGKMISLGIIAKVIVEVENKKEVQYYVNPMYFFSSNRIPLSLYLLFRRQLDNVLPDWVKQEYMRQKR